MFLICVFQNERFNRFLWFLAYQINNINNNGTLRKCYLFSCCVREGFSTFERFEHSTGTRPFNWGKLDSIATRLRERAVTSLEVRDQTTNWYSKGKLNFGSNSVYSCTRSVPLLTNVIGDVIKKSVQSNLLIYDFYNHWRQKNTIEI